MSEKLCTLRTKGGGGGGKYTETSLWTNSAPTSSFANTTVTLSQSIDNFKYIGIKYKPTTTSSDTDMTIMLVSDVKKSLVGASDINLLIGNTDSAGSFVRRVFYISSTQIRIDAAYRINTAGNNNADTIPLEILGLNELDHGKVSVAIGSVTIPSGSDTVTITDIGFEPTYLFTYAGNGTNNNEMTMDDYSNNIHYCGMKKAGTSYIYYDTSRITAKSQSSVTIDSLNSNLRGQVLYYYAIGQVSV